MSKPRWPESESCAFPDAVRDGVLGLSAGARGLRSRRLLCLHFGSISIVMQILIFNQNWLEKTLSLEPVVESKED